ncbi:16601_t:CDS:1, partial [Gigaspora margarita]
PTSKIARQDSTKQKRRIKSRSNETVLKNISRMPNEPNYLEYRTHEIKTSGTTETIPTLKLIKNKTYKKKKIKKKLL